MSRTDDRLETWAEIAHHLGRDIRTARRYEAERGMPVRRLPGGGKAQVYALRSEIDAWRRGSAADAPAVSVAATPTPLAPSGVGPQRWWVATAAAVLAIGGGLVAARLARPGASSGGPLPVVVAALENDTGEAVFDRLVPRLLQIDLTQSPRLQVAGDARVAQTLSLMERPRDAALTPALAREVCARGGGGAVVAPGAARLSGRYVLTLAASDCVSGRALAQDREVVANREDVPQALDRLSARTRRKLGESRASVARLAVPLLPARTASFDALQAYSQAMWLAGRGQDVEAVPLFRRAIELDGGFGLAWLGLAQTYFHARQWREDADAAVHAYALRASLSERDELFAAYHYHVTVEKDLVAALGSLRALAQLYPDDAAILNNLSSLQFDLGEYDDAIADAERAMRADPRATAARFNLMRALTRSGQAAQARAVGKAAAKAGLVDSRVYEERILAAIELGDAAEAKRLVDAAAGTPFERDALLQYSSIFGDGRAQALDATIDRADVLGRRQGMRMDWPSVAAALADLGADERARRRLALVEPDLRVGKFNRAEALVGDPAQAQADLVRDEARWPKDTLRNAEYGPEARAILALRRGDPKSAVRATSAPDPFEWRTLEFPYVRAEALLAAGDGAAAASAFRAILAHPGWSNWPQYGLSHLGLAHALQLQGDRGGALREYDAFLDAWRRADQEMPQPRQVREERATLAAHP